MCAYDTEASTIWTETTPKARKEYVCAECGRLIPLSTKHVRLASLFDGAWTTTRAHVECVALTKLLNKLMCDEGGIWVIGDLTEHLRETNILDSAEARAEVVAAWKTIAHKYPRRARAA